jgi:hypothetical protein
MKPLQLLHLEWQRFSPNATFRVITALYALFFILAVFMGWAVGDTITMNMNGTIHKPGADFFVAPKNWQVMAWIGSWVNVYLLGFLGVFMTTLEFSAKTLRQGIIFGLTRLETALAKMLSAAAIALAATLLYLGIGFGFCLLSGAGLSLPPALLVAGFFLQALGYLALGILAGLFIRHTALATLLYFAYVAFFECAGRWIFFLFTKSQALMFLPDSVLESLTPLPIDSPLSAYLSPLNSAVSIGVTVTYLALFALLIQRRLAKADL